MKNLNIFTNFTQHLHKSKKYTGFYIAGIVLSCLLLSGFVLADDDPVILKIITQLGKWADDYPVEKVYLQLDKPYYAAGDDIWFKAYVTVGSQHRLSALSGNVNVELIDDKDSVKSWVKLPLIQGTAWGDFKLTDTLQAGNYRIRAYTNWMRNAGPAYYFDKLITIANAPTDTVFTKTNYTYATVKDQQQVTATITYTNLEGNPYTGKPVNYTVQYTGKVLARGKGITNDKGNIVLSFINPENAQAIRGNIVTGIQLNEKHTVTKTAIINASSGKVDVQFFPESGSLVNGLASRVAFKAVGPDGFGVSIKGVVTDNENNKIASFSTQHLGMGSFNIIPQSGKTYKALITYADGSENTVNLPAALNSGYVLTVDNKDENNINLSVAGSADLAGAGNLYVVGQCGGEIRYVGENQSAGTAFNATVPKSKFPAGIVQFTLFSAKGDPMNERIAFVQHDDSLLKLDIRPTKATSAPREKVRMDLGAQIAGRPVIGNFSAAVIDDDKVSSDELNETTILSHLLLTSDLRGYIEQPNYYFSKTTETTRADLDVLMLTQGYRRFEWKPVMAGTVPSPAYEAEKLINLSGNVKTLTGKPVAGAKVTMLSSSGAGQFMLDTVANQQGIFTFKNLILEDSVKFVVKAYAAGSGKNVAVNMDNNDRDMVTQNQALSAFTFNSDYALFAPYLKADKKLYNEELKYGLGNHYVALQEVTIKEQKKVRVGLEHSSNVNGPGNADQVVTAEDLEKRGCLALDECLNGMLTGVIFRNDTPYSTRGGGHAMLIVLDGVPQNNALEKDFLGTIPVHDVASIEVLRDIRYTAVYGTRGSSGVIIINTKHGDFKGDIPKTTEPSTIVYAPKGYYRAREFYSPQYDDPKINQSVADLRTTIYWKPNIVTDKTGHAFLEYYNAGSPGTYRVIIEGIDAEGHLGHAVYLYKVE